MKEIQEPILTAAPLRVDDQWLRPPVSAHFYLKETHLTSNNYIFEKLLIITLKYFSLMYFVKTHFHHLLISIFGPVQTVS